MVPFSVASLLALSIVAATASAEKDASLETSNFNVTEALLDHGVDVAEIPALTDDGKRSEKKCAAAIILTNGEQCASLKFLYGDEAVETSEDAAYDAFTQTYWSGIQAEVNPYCIFKPSKAEHVSIVVLLSRLTQCPFAAKSGGHAAFAGASSIEGGITVSFINLKGVSLSKNKKIASIGPGNTWGPVYEQLTKSDVTVLGGRLSNIGVGGLTTGGGISYFSNLYGWACDSVESFEVVLANGAIVKASSKQHSDLYWALRGGGNNFGLVVNFNLITVPLPKGEMWGGTVIYSEDKFPEVADAFVNIINNSPQDPKAGLWLTWAYFNGSKLAVPELYYAEPDGDAAAIFDDFTAIESISDTTQNQVLSEFADENMEVIPHGLREIYSVITTKVDHHLLAFARDLFYENIPELAGIPGISPNLVFQGITIPQLQHMKKNGGNALGLDTADGPFFLILLSAMWEDKSDDAVVYQWISDVLEKITAEAKKRGVDNDYVYMNYASQFQDVVATYGASNKAKLKKVAKKYDPQQVFQVLQPGYFKLDRAPVPNSGYFSH
ncbi:hypothetical protein B0T10DRAFT_415774 [Thelonectria olida]|uniref:FAD-binding PCMH-type domain-containing protein n=1 Tax=Thelonectria olida TaxID=1576542 RepID=A0A9P8VR32_9HYPO|nr:hypothetical protein B0T10DRAFT_415774 [Thelonectria olida]